MKSFFNLLFIEGMILLFLSTGCVRSSKYFEPSKSDKLTSSEKHALVNYSRKFLLRSKIPLTPIEKKIIARTPPIIGERYTDYKTGDINIKWPIKDKKNITVKGTGDLQKAEKCLWRVSIFKLTQNNFRKKK